MTYTIKGAGIQISDLDILRLERKLGVRLPIEYKQFLMRNNGGRPVPKRFSIEESKSSEVDQTLDFFSIDDPIESCRRDWNHRVFSKRMPNGFFPIACEDGGNIICLSLSSNGFGSV